MMRYAIPVMLLTSMLMGCERDEPVASTGSGAGETAALPAELILAAAPEDARELAAVKESAKPGDEVVVRGVIGGREHPLAENRAVFMLVDSSVTTCDSMPADGCATPWDACCEDPQLIKQKSATVQVVDAQGQPLKQGLSGVGGIAPNKRIVVKGKVRDDATGESMIIDATGIYVQG